jgi:preprotein translocase subunit YajC
MNTQEIILTQVTPSTGPINKTETQVADTPVMANKPEPIGAVWTLMMPILLVVGLYMLFMRPQYKKEKALRESLKKLSKGDRVVTRGGIWGTVVGVKEQEGIVVVKIADDVKVEVSSSAIESINPQTKAQEKAAADAAANKKAKKA